MTNLRYIFSSIKHYWRLNLPVTLGVVLCSMVLTGALLIGDSVRFSLNRIVNLRLGKTTHALVSGEHFFTSSLAKRLQKGDSPVHAPLLHLPGIVSTRGGRNRANAVQVLGVNSQFWKLAPASPPLDLDAETAAINYRLADYLKVKIGDSVLIRVEKPSVLPKDVPLTSDSEGTVTLRVKVKTILNDDQFGRFSLKSDQVIPFSIVVDLATLGKTIEQTESTNIILSNTETTENDIRSQWSFKDIGLATVKSDDKTIQIDSKHVFISPEIEKSLTKCYPNQERLFTYFVNEFRFNDKACPYSFVSSTTQSNLKDNEIIISDWLADDLEIKPGDSIDVRYYVIDEMRRLQEASKAFIVKEIKQVSTWSKDQLVTPHYPGLSDSENCSDWDPGLPVNTEKIRDKDEKYWDDYKTTPKAFISYKAAQAMWGNRFGKLTAMRISTTKINTEIEAEVLRTLKPSSVNLGFRSVKSEATSESQGGVDFSGLFIGLSFFIITSALMIMGMLFSFSMSSRSSETAILKTMGFTSSHIKKLMLFEGMLIAGSGSFIGALLGIFYCQFVINALTTSSWQGAVNSASLQAHYSIPALISGAIITIVLSAAVMWNIIRILHKRSVNELLSNTSRVTKGKCSLVITVLSLSGALASTTASFMAAETHQTGLFYGAGTLMLIGLLSLTNYILTRIMNKPSAEIFSLSSVITRSIARRKSRSVTAISSISCGIFLIIAVAANQKGTQKDATLRQSGTGGFAYYAETAIPVYHDLNTAPGRDFYGLSSLGFTDNSFVQIRVKSGDDASCLNLNRVVRPQLIGLAPNALDSRGSFSFAALSDEIDKEHPWLILDKPIESEAGDIIPAIADQAVIQWGLGKAIGDEIEYISESGKPFKIRLVAGLKNSIFQGSLIISNEMMTKLYPSSGGTKIVLIDHIDGKAPDSTQLRTALEDTGATITSTAKRLAMFGEIENTYLTIFLALGGLGIIIGTIGLGVVVLRSILERSRELATLRAIGYQKKQIFVMIFKEHGMLLATGSIVGTGSALTAVAPSLIATGSTFPFANVIMFVVGIIVVGLVSIYAAAKFALHGPLLQKLREE